MSHFGAQVCSSLPRGWGAGGGRGMPSRQVTHKPWSLRDQGRRSCCVSNSSANFLRGTGARGGPAPALSPPHLRSPRQAAPRRRPTWSAGAAAAPAPGSGRRPHGNPSPQLPPSYIWGPLFFPRPYKHFMGRHPRPFSAPPTPTPLPAASPS